MTDDRLAQRLTRLQARLGVSTGESLIEDPWGLGLKLWALPLSSPQYQRHLEQGARGLLSVRILNQIKGENRIKTMANPGQRPEVTDLDQLLQEKLDKLSPEEYTAEAERERELTVDAMVLLVQRWEGHTYFDEGDESAGEEVPCTEEEKRRLFEDPTLIPFGQHGAGRPLGQVLAEHVLKQLQVEELTRSAERAIQAKNSGSSSDSVTDEQPS